MEKIEKKVLLILADGFEEIEAISALDILRRAGCQVTLAGLKNMRVESARNLMVQSEILLADVQGDFDALVLPGGGIGAQNLAASAQVKEWILRLFNEGKIVAAICAAPALVLAPTGILNGLRATGYPGIESPNVSLLSLPVSVDKNVITGRGPGSAIAFALAIVEQLCGLAQRQKIERELIL